MVTRRYAVFDDDFGLSDRESSEEEEEDLYALLGDPIVLCSDTMRLLTNMSTVMWTVPAVTIMTVTVVVDIEQTMLYKALLTQKILWTA